MKKNLFVIAIIGLALFLSTPVSGQVTKKKIKRKIVTNSKRTPTRHGASFLDGGNDSWNTRRKSTKRRQNLQSDYGGLGTANESPGFGTERRSIKKQKVQRKTGSIKKRAVTINAQTPADWNERHRRKKTSRTKP